MKSMTQFGFTVLVLYLVLAYAARWGMGLDYDPLSLFVAIGDIIRSMIA